MIPLDEKLLLLTACAALGCRVTMERRNRDLSHVFYHLDERSGLTQLEINRIIGRDREALQLHVVHWLRGLHRGDPRLDGARWQYLIDHLTPSEGVILDTTPRWVFRPPAPLLQAMMATTGQLVW